MASKLLKIGPFDAANQLEVSLRLAFEEFQPTLRPPFPLFIPSPPEYLQLNRAILYGVLTEPQLANTHIKYLHALVTDGYAFVISLLVKIVDNLYSKLLDSVKDQLIWVVKEIVNILGIGFAGLLVTLMRQIIGGDFSDGNLWLCFELVSLFLSNFNCLLEEEPLVLSSALYVFLRLLADHCRVSSNAKIETLKILEIEFCVKMLREQFHLCMKIGRDLVRLLQDLVHVPAFRAIWKDLLLNCSAFRTVEFLDLSQLYCTRTSSRYFLLRITPEMEAQLRFLLLHVKFGSQKRHQSWFVKKFLSGPDRESLIVDIVRFICCAHHPSNETIQSEIIPRWAILGWLLTVCRNHYIQANAKLALFYDWLFFDEKVDNIMNIEPGMLLMVCSMPKYIDMTHSLLEFLLLLGENYDVERAHVIIRGISAAFTVLVQKGVVQSLDVLTSSDALSPFLKERLGRFLSSSKVGVFNKLWPQHFPHYTIKCSNLQNQTCLETPTSSPDQQHADQVKTMPSSTVVDTCITFPINSIATCCATITNSEIEVNVIEKLLQNLKDSTMTSHTAGLQILEAILLSVVNLDAQAQPLITVSPEILCSRIVDHFESMGCKLFTPLDCNPTASCSGCEIRSATAIIIRTLIFSQHLNMQRMFLFWSRNGFLVGAHLLAYASQLAYEAHIAGLSENAMPDNYFAMLNDLDTPLLTFHVNGYFSFLNSKTEHSSEDIMPTSEVNKQFIIKLVGNAFAGYRHFLECSSNILHKADDTSLSKRLCNELILCVEWDREKAKFLFCCIFHHLADVSVGAEDIIQLVVSELDYVDLLDIQFKVGLKKFSMFGENTETISLLIKNSFSWDSLEQHKLWGLISSELSVSMAKVEKIILEILCFDDLDVKISSIAVGGLLSLCASHAPTPELVGIIMFIPDNVFQDFAATALATWVISNPSMLLDSLAKFSENLSKKNGDAICSGGITINRTAVLWLLNYFTAQGMNASDILSNLPSDILGG